MRSHRPSFYAFYVLSFLLAGCFTVFAYFSHRQDSIQAVFAIALGSACVYILCLYTHRTVDSSLSFILTMAVFFRIILLLSTPILSDDIYRYLWEGKMQLVGINPYVISPDAPETLPFRDHIFPHINHKDLPTIYPPLSELIFAFVAGICYSVTFMKLVLILFDCVLIMMLLHLLKQRRRPLSNILFYAWNPLVLFEIAGSGHMDIIGITFLWGAIMLYQQRRDWAGVTSLLCSGFVKLFPFMLLPIFLRRHRWITLTVLIPLCAVIAAPYLDSRHLFQGLFAYLRSWEHNASIYACLNGLIQHHVISKAIIAGLFVLIYVWVWRHITDDIHGACIMLGSFLLLAPTCHPWYLLWILPFCVLKPMVSWIVLSGSVLLSYNVLIGYTATGHWEESFWIKALEFIPFYIILFLELKRARQTRSYHGDF